MRVLFTFSHTLYAKSLIPLMIQMAKEGAEVTVKTNRPGILRYSVAQQSKNPTRHIWINQSSIEAVAKMIGYSEDFARVQNQLHYSLFPSLKKFDAIIGVSKDLKKLSEIQKRTTAATYVLGYQHFPVLLSLDRPLEKILKISNCEDAFLNQNSFSNQHGFMELIRKSNAKDFRCVDFTYLAPSRKQKEHVQDQSKDVALIFHPGGYRNVLTPPGASKKISYEQQEKFLKDVCSPLLSEGLVPVVKVHPLWARYHSEEDLRIIQKNLALKNPAFQKLVVTSDSYWPYAFRSKLILTLGSSSVYELYAAGLNNVFVLNYFGKERSSKFQVFEKIMVQSQREFEKLVSHADSIPTHSQWTSEHQTIFTAYRDLQQCSSTNDICSEILRGAHA